MPLLGILNAKSVKRNFIKIRHYFWSFNGSGEKSYKYVGFRYVISIESLVFLGMLTYLMRYIRVPNVPRDVRGV